MSLVTRAATVTDIGLVRSNNEDSAFAGRRLFAVADGVGGLPAGEFASDIAIKALASLDEETDDEPLTALRDALHRANYEIAESALANPEHEGMGTTVTALLFEAGTAALAHVGDSRAYLLRAGALRQLSTDHTFVQSLVDQGILTPEEARNHPHRSVVTQAVQGYPLHPATLLLPAEPGDRFLLCSDGLSDYVADDVIATLLGAGTDPQSCAEALVTQALSAGAPDNVTVVVVDLTQE
jgi:protein phosphatase